MISVVIVGRNDNYGGDFESRLFATTRYNFAEFERRGIEAELIFVEWNPLSDRPWLSQDVAAAFPQARCFVVDGSVHRLISQNRYIKVFEYHAKNVGAKRAQGDWLLLTNPDNFFGSDVLDFLQAGAFSPDTFYRAGWIEIDDESDVDRTDLIDVHATDGRPYCRASGDFFFCAKSLFDRVGGFREDLTFTNTHKDSILCHAFYDVTKNVRKIGTTYHLKHTRDGAAKRRLQYDWKKVDRRPQDTFGLAGLCVETVNRPQISTLSLPDELLKEAKIRQPVEPIVPRDYRLSRRRRSGLENSVRRVVKTAIWQMRRRLFPSTH
jgi:hypothetical protein